MPNMGPGFFCPSFGGTVLGFESLQSGPPVAKSCRLESHLTIEIHHKLQANLGPSWPNLAIDQGPTLYYS